MQDHVPLGGFVGGGQGAAAQLTNPTILNLRGWFPQLFQNAAPAPVEPLSPVRSAQSLAGYAEAGASTAVGGGTALRSMANTGGEKARPKKRLDDKYRLDQVAKQKVRRAGASQLWAALDEAAPAKGSPPPLPPHCTPTLACPFPCVDRSCIWQLFPAGDGPERRTSSSLMQPPKRGGSTCASGATRC